MASEQVRAWWRKLTQRPMGRLLLQVSAVASILTTGSLFFSNPRERLPRSALERVTGTVVAKEEVYRGRARHSDVIVATARGKRGICLNPYHAKSWGDIHVGDRLEGLVGYSVAVEMRVNERFLFSYEDYCREYDRDRRFCSELLGALAGFSWFAVVWIACRLVTPSEPR